MFLSYFIEHKTLAGGAVPPDPPYFQWELLPSEDGHVNIKVQWLPNIDGNSGSHFFVKYRIKGQTTWIRTDQILDSDYVIIRALQPDRTYEFCVVSVDGGFTTESKVMEVSTESLGPVHIPSEDSENAVWRGFRWLNVFG